MQTETQHLRAVYGQCQSICKTAAKIVFLVLSGLFLGTLGMLNILGISRFVNVFTWGDLAVTVAVGVLPYPLTFLCTDLISELYGKERANQVVWVGLALNIWVLFIVWLGGVLPGFEAIDPATGEIARDAAGRLPVFFEIRNLTFGAVTASMMAYLTAQFVDVYLFHFWKAANQRQASVVAQQRLYPSQPAGRYHRCGADYPLFSRGAAH
jgi:uncharacterized integral membrane protein (TIGR00697 family)